MRGLLEAVPNFSVGRDLDVLAAIRAAIEPHARVLDVHADADHNRSVFTCVGDAAGLVEGLEEGIAVAASHIDLGAHEGVHPRVGAADVVPIVRFRAGDPEPLAAARALGERIGRLGIPVLGYAELGDGRRPAYFRAGGTEALAARLAAGETVPLYGPARLHPTAGAVLLGVRPPLVAFNVDLGTDDVEVARVASERGVAVERGELVGLMPATTAAAAAGAALRIEGMAADRVLEVAAGGEFGG
jgi:glutamate formiminotransferase / 5-formyltetrahydrofolate cyclo-ligase